MFGGSFPPGILLQRMRFHPGSLFFQGQLRAIGNAISNSVMARNSVSDGPLRPPRLRRFRGETRTLNPASTFSVSRHGGRSAIPPGNLVDRLPSDGITDKDELGELEDPELP